MPIQSSIYITASVGHGGRNNSADVLTIQKRLNALMHPPRKPLAMDGLSGPNTEGVIADFQINVLNFRRPDRRVDPGGKTIRALNDPASEGKWARMSMVPNMGAGAASMPTEVERDDFNAAELSRLEGLYEATADKPELKEAADMLDDLVKHEVGLLKKILHVQGVVSYTVEFLEGLANLRRAGYTAREFADMFRQLRASKRYFTVDDLIATCRALKGNPPLKKALTGIGRAAAALTVLVIAVEAFNHFRHGRIGPAMAEIWGGILSAAVPWAAALNAIQALGYALFPGVSSNPKVETAFAVFNAIDPIGASQSAIDAQYTVLQTIAEWISTGKLNMSNLQQFVDRLEDSPMRLWTPLGNDIGDWMADNFGQWTYETFLK